MRENPTGVGRKWASICFVEEGKGEPDLPDISSVVCSFDTAGSARCLVGRHRRSGLKHFRLDVQWIGAALTAAGGW
jgi:hypothetical protein